MTLDWGLNDNKGSGTGAKDKKHFTKFQEGITKIRLLMDAGERPYMRWTHWMAQFSRKVTCPGRGCPIDEIIRISKANKTTAPYASSKSFSFNIWNYATEQHEIMEEGITMVEGLLDFLSEYATERAEEHEKTVEKLGKEVAGELKPLKINELVIKVRKKKNSSGKFVWTFSLDSENELSGKELEAFENRYNFEEYYTVPTIEQVQALLEVSASSKDEYINRYNEIMGYAKKDETTVGDEDLGVEVE